MMDYQAFLESKKPRVRDVGRIVAPDELNAVLFPLQKYCAAFGIQKGRAAIFADTGLGKTFMQLEFGRLIGKRGLIIAPLQVARQTVKEAAKLLTYVHFTTSSSDLRDGINITNYENAHRFNPADFDFVILDESSILKALDSKSRINLTAQWRDTPYKLATSATPAPNDLKEIVNHAEWLGIMSRKEVFATFFINDSGDELKTRLKRHAVKDFYRWMAGWAIAVKRPSDLGFSDEGYELPGLDYHEHPVVSNYRPAGMLVHVKLSGVTDRAKVQRATMPLRCATTAEIVQSNQEQWIIWHHLNDEGYALQKLIPDAVLVEGKQSAEQKTESFERFIAGDARVLITKPSIAGFGLNLQHSWNQCWAGINDSFEELYQAIRRQYRFGQTQRVQCHLVYADVQEAVLENIQRKERDAEDMSRQLVDAIREYNVPQLQLQSGDDYLTDEATGDNWTLKLGDSVERLAELPDDSIHLSVFSPPFINRYAYTASERDLGNCMTPQQFMRHSMYVVRQLYRVMMPGRNVCVHLQQVRTTKRDTGEVGLIDFRGMTIRSFQRAGFVYYSDFTIDKSAQIQAKRKHHVSLLYKTKDKDSSKSGSALADYLLVFKKPGDNPFPVKNEKLPKHIWNEWAKPVWYGIDETDVLPTQMASENDDEMHLCPLQLPVIWRCVELWCNPGETVLDPFNGVGSTGYEAVRRGRKYIGVELKPSYWKTSIINLQEADLLARQKDLFEYAGIEVEI